MTLLELTEPIFQYVCRLNRLARKSVGTSTGETAFITKGPGAAAIPRSGDSAKTAAPAKPARPLGRRRKRAP